MFFFMHPFSPAPRPPHPTVEQSSMKLYPRFAFAAAIGSLLALSPLSSAAPRQPGSPPSSTPASPSPTFLSPRTTVSAGGTAAIPFSTTAALHDILPTVNDADILRVLSTFSPAPDSTTRIGFVRIHALKPGLATLSLAGASILVHVLPASAHPADAPSIRIVNPAPGAAAWGTIAVGVEFSDDTQHDSPHPSKPDTTELLLLLASDGREFSPITVSTLDRGPTRHALFELPATPPSPATSTPNPPTPTSLTLRAVRMRPGSRPLQSHPVTIHLHSPTPPALLTGEAEAAYELKRPDRFPAARPTVSRDPAASAGKFLNNAGAYPAFCFPIHAESPGLYQVILTARGDFAGAAFPTVAIYRDDADQPITNARITSESWRRFTIGVPFPLTTGPHVITSFFENDFYIENLADRNLAIDSIEVLRLPDSLTPGAPVGADPDSMMMDGAMMMNSPTSPPDIPASDSMMMSAGARAAGSPANLLDATLAPAPLRVAFTHNLDSLPAAGELQIDALCAWTGQRAPRPSPPPRVSLLVNNIPVATQRSASPRFIIDPRAWTPGDNTVELIARLDSGHTARTPVHRITWTPPSAPSPTSAPATDPDPNPTAYFRRFERFTIHDQGWDPSIKPLLQSANYPSESLAAALNSNTTVTFSLPVGLTGDFDLQIESLGQEFQGPPILAASLLSDSGSTPIGQTPVQSWWAPRSLGRVHLAGDASRLSIAFINDHYEHDKGDRNVAFQALVLREIISTPDSAPPSARILYPGPSSPPHDVFMQSALVADFADNLGVARVELLIDGLPSGIAHDRSLRPGRVVLPILTRALSPGHHTIALRATDAEGNYTDSPPATINVLTDPPTALLPYERAVRLLNLFALGPDNAELAAILIMGESAWLRDRLSRDPADPAELNAHALSLVRFPTDRSEYDIPRRALLHAMLTPNPLRARFVLWAQNHFSTWIRKTEPDRKWDEHVAFSHAGVARFPQLLRLSATSPAMLRYLDQDRSFARRLNENYAREIMELHTLGVHAGYSQSDVTSLARLLTGWTTVRQGDGSSPGELRADEFRFDPSLSDGEPLPFLGVNFPAAPPASRHARALLALDLLAAHPATARFISRKLIEHYALFPAPDHLIDSLALTFTSTGGDLREVLLALAASDDLFRRDSPDRLAHPLLFSLRLSRATSHANPWGVGDFLQRSGVGLFDRSTPDGYPDEDSAYTDSNAVLQRWRFVQDMWWQLAELVPADLRWGDLPADNSLADAWSLTVIDLLAVEVTGRVLSPDSTAAALAVARQSTGPKQDRLQTIIPFIAQLPEFSLR